jgi:predicted transposase YdaD
VIRLWEVPTEQLLTSSGLFPFAVLSQTDNPEQVLEQVAVKIEEIEENKQKCDVTATTAILAGLVLDKMMIRQLLKEEIMRESVIYQDIQETSEARGIKQGIKQEAVKLVIRQLNRRIGQISPDLTEKVQLLSVEQLENLGEALLDFQIEEDLINWLNS